MKYFVLTILLLISLSAVNGQNLNDDDLQKLIGQYDISTQCDSWYCDRTSFEIHSNNYCCPLEGNNGKIRYDKDHNIYYIEFKTYNMFWATEFFYATFTEENKVDTPKGAEIRIPLDQGYVMNIIPCYHGEETQRVCSDKSEYPQLAIYKTRPNFGTDLEWCSFTMTKIL